MRPDPANGIQALIDRAHRFFDQDLWDIEIGGLPTFRKMGVRATRILSLAWQGMVQNECLVRASALTYISILALVPLLAFTFAVAKGLGAYDYLVENTINPALDQLAPPVTPGDGAGEGGAVQLREVAEGLINFVENTNFANLGLVGFTFLMFAALKLIDQIEASFNAIWGVPRSRTIVRKIADFVALIVVTPLLMAFATTITAVARHNAVTEWMTEALRIGPALQFVLGLLPWFLIGLGFCFLYMVMPNTRVRFLSAAIGGVVGGVLWVGIQIGHVTFQVGVARYNAIYSGFAAFPIFLVWVYMNWVAVLLGALVAWAHQAEPAYRQHKKMRSLSLIDRDLVALQALTMIGRSFAAGGGATPVGAVAAHCHVAPSVIQEILRPLVEANVVATTDDGGDQGLLPARPLAEIRVVGVLRALRGERRETFEGIDAVSGVVDTLRAEIERSPNNLTVSELIERTGG